MRRALLALAILAACKGGDDAPARRMSTANPPPEQPPAAVDAGVPVSRPAQPAPAGEQGWLDPIPGEASRGARTTREPSRAGRPVRFVQLTLRSSPPGATVYLDGERIGVTPTFWEGEADARPRDFTFTLPGHVTARYRFVPITDGHLYPRLEKLAAEQPDAGPEPAP